jgi:hypothetical protein
MPMPENEAVFLIHGRHFECRLQQAHVDVQYLLRAASPGAEAQASKSRGIKCYREVDSVPYRSG